MPAPPPWLYLPAADRGIVVFKFWQALPYTWRFCLSFLCIGLGVGGQYALGEFFPGCLGLLLGNLLLVVQGYDNRADLGKYDPSAQWEIVEAEKLRELRDLDLRIKAWDVSALDCTNLPGGSLFVLLFLAGIGLSFSSNVSLRIITWDAMILLLPHWMTGTRSILLKPNLVVKATLIDTLLQTMASELQQHYRVDILLLLRGATRKIPEDVKCRIRIEEQQSDFLGLYGQVVINTVQGRSYPYFYVVLAARKGYGLQNLQREYQDIVAEWFVHDQVEVLVLRKIATVPVGYYTEPAAVQRIFCEGLALAEEAAVQAW